MIRYAEIEDIIEIVKLEKAELNNTLGEKFLYQEFTENDYSKYYVYELNKQIIGYIGYRYFDDSAEMMNFVVAKTHQNHGYGLELLNYSLNDLTNMDVRIITLEVRESNIRAQHVYEKVGFIKSHIRKSYYKKEDAIVYMKEVLK